MKRKKSYMLLFIFIILLILFIRLIYLYISNAQNSNYSNTLKHSYNLSNLFQTTYYTSPTNSSIIGKIIIDKLNISYPIFSETTTENLNLSVCRFSGPLPNTPGNLCIAGHNNYDNTFFSNINKLNYNDEIKIVDSNNQLKKYNIFLFDTISPSNLSYTTSISNESIITLITCSKFNKRFIIQAKEQL